VGSCRSDGEEGAMVQGLSLGNLDLIHDEGFADEDPHVPPSLRHIVDLRGTRSHDSGAAGWPEVSTEGSNV
jgi:hypothetical protein